jgi:transposase InsO family protein
MAERCRRTLGWELCRDLLDHVIPVNERHLKRLLSDYVRYYHEDRTHLGLQKETPAEREISGMRDSSLVASLPQGLQECMVALAETSTSRRA